MSNKWFHERGQEFLRPCGSTEVDWHPFMPFLFLAPQLFVFKFNMADTFVHSRPCHVGLWSSECLSGAERADRERSWVTLVPTGQPWCLWSACAISSQSSCSRVRLSSTKQGAFVPHVLDVRCFSEPKFWYLVYMLVFMAFLLMWL